MNLSKNFEKGIIYDRSSIIQADLIGYIPHQSFIGVSLKHLVKGGQTDNQLSCHLVKVEPNCALDTHIHGDHLEIHEVIYGEGECCIADNQVNYKAGVVGVILPNTPHKVVAGKEGLYLLATFSPALI